MAINPPSGDEHRNNAVRKRLQVLNFKISIVPSFLGYLIKFKLVPILTGY